MMKSHSITAAVLLALGLPLAGLSQDQSNNATQQPSSGDKIDLATWDQTELYKGWSVEAMFGMPVRGKDGNEIGEIENIVVNADGKVTKVIVEAGGFLDIGDTHLAVSWGDITLAPDRSYIEAPSINADNIPAFSVFNDDDIDTKPRAWRATELLDDYVALQDVPGYAVVDDLIFDKSGQLQAVIVIPDVGYGPAVYGRYAYPYRGYDYNYDPGVNRYNLPYTRAEINNMQPFDYEELRERGEFAAMEDRPADRQSDAPSSNAN